MMDPNGKLKGDASEMAKGVNILILQKLGANLPTCLLTLHLFCMRAETRNSIVNIAEFDPFSLLSDKSLLSLTSPITSTNRMQTLGTNESYSVIKRPKDIVAKVLIFGQK